MDEKLSNVGIELKKQNILTLKPPDIIEEDSKIVPKKENVAPKMNTTNNVDLSDKRQNIVVETEISSDDDLALGASASPTEEVSNSPPALPALFDEPSASSFDKSSTFRHNGDSQHKSNFVGLVNQAMTCYLNSLLQALFMTPEFRNALYNWEFDGNGESKSIPFQLQKLFVNLQTSNKPSVETTDLTKSFGWDSTEAWQQHDIQELCRVMFDALEQKFKNTKQSDLINVLYEGKMIDYVKCLECETEKSREDTFLDIPLPVRPFGSTQAYESVEEALKAFVQPETLDGNNQYSCEKCEKKCDAHKGLKFKKFPYILTLHLKRFDFDYETLHRIKLNDKVTFPQQLNLNGFISSNSTEQQNSAIAVKPNDIASIGSVESAVKSDDCSTTDSVLDEEGFQYHQNSNNFAEAQEDDEGIDMSVNGDTKSLMSNSTSLDSSNAAGPFTYDLFAIMIHSGSASGGHYYAYIKDLESGSWHSFNDQSVSPITQEDISKSFGGSGAFKSYYSGFSSSTNAYMLMYRQQDTARNSMAIKEENFPPHIAKLVDRIRNHEDEDRRKKEKESDMLKLKIYFKDPIKKVKIDTKVFAISESSLKEVLEDAYSRLKIKPQASIERCRLVAYDSPTDGIERSFEGLEKDQIGDIMRKLNNRLELLLEVRDEDKEFEVYEVGGITLKVFFLSWENKVIDIDGPHDVRAYEHKPISELKSAIAKRHNLNSSLIQLAVKRYSEKPSILQNDLSLKNECLYGGSRVFMTLEADEQLFKQAVQVMDNIWTLYFAMPNSKKETLEKLSIPSYEPQGSSADVVDSVAFNVVSSGECNSEDSSLSESDRTLVEDSNVVEATSSIPAPPPFGILRNLNSDQKGNDECDYFFKAVLPNTSKGAASRSVDSGNENDEDSTDSSDSQRILKVLADRRMSVNKLKIKLQTYVQIPMEYFKIFHVLAAQSENECTQLSANLSHAFKDEERLVIELGRALRKGEFKVKLYYLKVEEVTDLEKLPFICDYILQDFAEIGQTKREIIAHIRTLDEKYANLTFERTRLRKKSWKSPAQIFLNDQKFGDDCIIKVSTNQDIIIQELPTDEANLFDCDGEPINDDSKSLFVRRFYPSKLELGKWEEIMIGSK